ncbi:uncharacterized protein LOC135848487 isoform X2 [Planococcus citri]|uniref:uncharacterized protein LOC135848487 isoform X2 n=1 Tax=Planococcus citri TaxID=170843 RepID=UPI0031F7FE83
MHESLQIIVTCVLMCLSGHKGADTQIDVVADAKLIVDNNRAELIVMRIIPFRTPEQRKQINDHIRQLDYTPLIDPDYEPVTFSDPFTDSYLDLCYTLLTDDKNTILSKYMTYFLKAKNPSVIIILMLLVDDMGTFMKVYNSQHHDSFDESRKHQMKNFRNMLRVWAESIRPPDGDIDQKAVDNEAGSLNDEKPKWDKNRDQLEKVLMKSSYKMAKAILEKYEEKNQHPIEDDIRATIKNPYLVDAYCSLATYIKDKYTCLARKLHEQSDNEDHFATWNILVGTLKSDEWKQIDTSFKRENDNIGVVEFISHNIKGDFVLMETLAYLIDSTYKPKFLGVPAPIATPKVPSSPSQPVSHLNVPTPPSVPSTTVVTPPPSQTTSTNPSM